MIKEENGSQRSGVLVLIVNSIPALYLFLTSGFILLTSYF